jgi:hypothetical protein
MHWGNSHSHLRAGDIVAVLAWNAGHNGEVDEIATVQEVGPLMAVLTDGRTYSTRDGQGFGPAFGTRIRLAKVRDEMALAVSAN